METSLRIDGVKTYHWESSEVESWACMLFCPGQGDFASRYEEVLQVLIQGGIEVVAFDWPGHGLSSGHRGHVGSLKQARRLTDHLFEHLLRIAGPRPIGVSGHSMGGLMALDLLSRQERGEFGWISSPLLVPDHGQSPWLVRSARWLGKVLPRMTIDTGVRVGDCIRVEGDDLVEAPTDAFRDGQGHSRVSLGWGASLIQVARELQVAELGQFQDRQLVISQGTEDPVCPPEYCANFLSGLSSSAVKLVELEGALHEPFSEARGRLQVEQLLRESLRSWRSNWENLK